MHKHFAHRFGTAHSVAVALVTLCGVAGAFGQSGPTVPAGPVTTDPQSVVVLTYRGDLSLAGQPAQGTVDLRFTLHDALAGGNQLGSVLEATSVAVSQGRVTVDLPWPSELLVGGVRYVQVQVRSAGAGQFATLLPRQALLVAPIALVPGSAGQHTLPASVAAAGANQGTPGSAQASSAGTGAQAPAAAVAIATLESTSGPASGEPGGLDNPPGVWSANGSIIFYTDGSVGIGTSTPTSGLLEVVATSGNAVRGRTSATTGFGVLAEGTATSGENAGIRATSASTGGRGVWAEGLATSGSTIGVHGIVNSPAGRGVVGSARAATGTSSGVYGFNASNAGFGVFGDTTSTSGSTYGVYGNTRSSAGVGVFGNASSATGTTFGVAGESASSSGTGVSGAATASSGLTTGVVGTSLSSGGRGVYGFAASLGGSPRGVFGETVAQTGSGVHGVAQSSSGINFGVYGSSNSVQGTGVAGYGLSTTGNNAGVFGQSVSTGGTAVFGVATATSGNTNGVFGQSNSPSGSGVRGIAFASSGANYGVFGRTNSNAGWAGYFEGRGYFSGRVGIGITNPSTALDVDGEVRAGIFSFLEPKVRVISIGEAEFVAENSSVPVIIGGGGAHPSANPSTAVLWAPVVLPEGSTIVSVTAVLFDASSTSELNVSLQRYGEFGYQTLASMQSTGSGGIGNYTDSTISTATVDNENYAYAVRVAGTPEWNGSNMRVVRVVVRHTVIEAD